MLRAKSINLKMVFIIMASLCFTRISSAMEAQEKTITVEMPGMTMAFSPNSEVVTCAIQLSNYMVHTSTSMDYDIKQVTPVVYHLRRKSWKDIFWKLDINDKKVFREYKGSFGIKGGTETLLENIAVNITADPWQKDEAGLPQSVVVMTIKQSLFSFEPSNEKCRLAVADDEVLPNNDWDVRPVGIGYYQFRLRNSKGYGSDSFFEVDTVNMKASAVYKSKDGSSVLVNGKDKTPLMWRVRLGNSDMATDMQNNNKDESRWQHVEMNNMALKRSEDFKDVNGYYIQKYIASHDFQKLDGWFQSALDRYTADAQYETALQEWFDVFAVDKSSSKADIDLWVAQTGSPVSYAVRGIYKTPPLVYIARGGKYINEGSTEGRDIMQQRYNEAAKDLETAISKNPSLMPAYVGLLRIAAASKTAFTPQQIVRKAIKNDNRTYQVRYQYILSLKPERGGSYEEMSRFARQEMDYSSVNPQIWSLQGEADASRADAYYSDGNYSAAESLYTKALKFGDRIQWLKKRAACYDKIGQKDKSQADYEKLRYYSPNDPSLIGHTARADITKMDYHLQESSYVDPNMVKEQIQAYVVIPAENHMKWLGELSSMEQGVIKRNMDKLELTVMRLGYDCVERSKLETILNEQKLSLTGLTDEKAQYVGKLINADAVVIAEIPSIGVHHGLNKCFEDIYVRAVSVKTGKILWKSLLKGSVALPATANIDYFDVLDVLETKMYELLETKLYKEMNRK